MAQNKSLCLIIGHGERHLCQSSRLPKVMYITLDFVNFTNAFKISTSSYNTDYFMNTVNANWQLQYYNNLVASNVRDVN